MSAIACVLKQRGYSISGSDKKVNNIINKLKTLGVTIFKDQKSTNIEIIKNDIRGKILTIVISSAISEDNEELKEVTKRKIKILHRSDILAFLIDQQKSILIAGTHGKTTTSSLLSTIFIKNNQEPTVLVGGIIPHLKSNSYLGKSRFLIAEVDESDGTLVKYKANIALITNLELDHTNHYKNIDSLTKSMNKFANNANYLIANFDCPNLRKYLVKKPIWWSTKISNNMDFAAIPIEMDANKTIANYYEKGVLIDQITIYIPGEHNLNNALGAVAASRLSGIKFLDIKKDLTSLTTPNRRFEFKGTWNKRKVIDDYAHHPTEIKATISMARLIIKENNLEGPPKRLFIVFQPHRYSRLKDLMNNFATNLGMADFIILAPIYSAGESPIEGIDNMKLKSIILQKYPTINVINSNNFEDIKEILKKNTNENDLIVIMGAGDITKLSDDLTNTKKYNAA